MNKQLTVFLGCIVRNDEVLLSKRNEPDFPGAHEKWELAGGKSEFGETPEETVRREIFEETGVEVEVGKLLPYVITNTWHHERGDQQVFCFTYLCSVVSENGKIDDEEVLETKWFTFDEAKKLDALPGLKEVIESAEKELG